MGNKFELTILGSNSAMPAYGRWPTSQVLNIANQLILIDCGEGCQMRMLQYKIKKSKISHVLISHLHGDHIYGLPGFLGSLSHLSRKNPLYLYGPKGLKEYLEVVFKLSEAHFSFELIINELEHGDNMEIVRNDQFSIMAFPVAHRVSTYGYLIKENQSEKNIRTAAIAEYKLKIDEIKGAKRGEDILREDQLIKNSQLTLPQSKPRSYAYCADTCVKGWKKEQLRGVSLMYFETTYLHDLVELAHERGHTTAKEAGSLARQLDVEQLIIGHYSSRYKEVTHLLEEAQAEFHNVQGGYDGFILNID